MPIRPWIPRPRIVLRAALAAVMLAASTAALPQAPMQRAMATLAKIREFKALRDAGRHDEAAQTLHAAITDLEARGEDPVLLLPTYAQALLKLDRADEAIEVLERVRAAEQKAAQGPRAEAMNAFDAMTAMEATFGFARSVARQQNQDLLIVESDEPLPGTPLVDAWPEVTLPMVLLADAYTRTGKAAAAFELFDGPFAAYLKRRLQATDPDTRLNLDLAAEAACLRFALALARLGPNPRADRAFACALDINQGRLTSMGLRSPVRAFHRGNAAQRRAIVGAYAGYLLTPDRSPARDGHRLLEAVADSKGIATRYIECRAALIASSQQPELARLRPRLAALEQSLRTLPTQGNAAVIAQVQWANDEAALIAQALGPLGKEGLGQVFVPGNELLRQLPSRLGADALIGFAVYTPADRASGQALPARVLRYAVGPDGVEVVDVGTRREIDAAVLQWRRDGKAGGRELSQRLLGALPPLVAAARGWLIDPDGALNLLPFEALAAADGAPVIEQHVLRYVTSMAALAQPRPDRPAGTGAVVVADPVFDAAVPAGGTGDALQSMQTSQGVMLRDVRLAPMPETRAEAQGVAAALARMGVAADTRLGDRATLEAFAFRQGPRFLHVATHGLYFVPGPQAGGPLRVRVATVLPGLQSALALTPSREGALLTAADLRRLPLQGTELVVLSACDTGNGSVDVGEGVASLRRAVEEAGAASVVSSLWAVPSRATTALMVDFYGHLAAGLPKAQALREAKLALMRRTNDPMQWAGFLLSGAP